MTDTDQPTSTDEPYGEHVTIRRWSTPDGTLIRIDVFDGGRWTGTYKTERGALAGAARREAGWPVARPVADEQPDDELTFDEAEYLGFDGTLRDGSDPATYGGLTDEQVARLDAARANGQV